MSGKNDNATKYPKTLVQAVRYFSDPAVTLAFFVNLRWLDGVSCPHCGSTNVLFLANQSRWKCREGHARPQFTVKIGTIMEESPMGLDKWAVAFWLEVNAKNSISSYELGRALGITQKSAWFMLHRIRLATQDGSSEQIGGNGRVVEADETFVGGLAKNMHKHKREKAITGTGGTGKTAVMGLLERHGPDKCSQVRATVVDNTRRDTLHDVIRKHVAPETNVYTDAWQAYRNMGPNYFHDFVDHAEAYVKGAVHTNGLENFWALFKRCIKGTHVAVEPFHLGRYVDSEAFRFNNREFKDGERFLLALRGMEGKRITYKALTGALGVAPGSDRGEGSASLPN
jgi:transposase-like protein